MTSVVPTSISNSNHYIDHTASVMCSKNINYLGMLQSEVLRDEFNSFSSTKLSSSPLFVSTVVISCVSIPMAATVGIEINNGLSLIELYQFIGLLTLLLIINIALWISYSFLSRFPSTVPQSNTRSHLWAVQFVLYVALDIIGCIFLVIRVDKGRCRSNDEVFSWDCNVGSYAHSLPVDSTFIISMIPVIYMVMIGSSRLSHVWALIFLSNATIVGCAWWAEAVNSIAFVILSIVMNCYILYETRRQSLLLFFIHKIFDNQSREKDLAAVEENATEMRHMIANLAHDLKTVRKRVR